MSNEDQNQARRQIPVRSDEPVPMMLIFTATEFITICVIMGVSIATDAILLGIVVIIPVMMGMREMKRGAKRGAALHALWAMGFPAEKKMRAHFPSPFVNEFLE